MANVLGELFSEIATSIRGGLGDIGAMKPNAFPDKIDEIVELLNNAGSGGGSGEGGNGDSDSPSISNRFQLKKFSVTTDALGSKVVINHGMGKMPDMVFVFFADYDKDGPVGEIANGSYMLATYAMKREFNPAGVCQFYITRWISFSTGTVGEDKPTTDITSEDSTAVFCPNDTQICFGSGNLAPNSNFNVIALSGVGGGSSADIRYVTFMDDTGTKVLGKKAVAVGDDCADPIARGIFETPTKESTPQYSYTFSGGWATTPGGGKDSNALKAVTEDRTVYANFISTLRYYTITYYDDDGVTVLKTESLAYGSVPSFSPKKEGFAIGGWVPEIASVTGTASYTAQWVEQQSFTYASWDKIAEICESGSAAAHFSVGDTKTIQLKWAMDNSITDVEIEIIGINHDDLADGSGKAGITIGTKNALSRFYYLENGNVTLKNGWANSTLRSALHSTVFNNLPADMTKHIKTVKKLSTTAYGDYLPVESEDKLFVPSITEFTGTAYQNYYFGVQYAGYNTLEKRRKYSQNSLSSQSSSTVVHESRLNATNGNNYFACINASGALGGNANSGFTCLCFCI